MRVLIAIPHTGIIRAELVQVLLRLKKIHEYTILLANGRPIDHNRNQIVDVFMKEGFDYLLMIDSDIEPPVDVLKIVDNKADVCSADIVTSKGKEVIRLAMKKVQGGYRYEPIKEGLIEVDATGTGCMCISRKVFEKMAKPYFQFIYRNGILINGEDFNFCEKAKELGFKIMYDTRIKCNHFQTYPLS